MIRIMGVGLVRLISIMTSSLKAVRAAARTACRQRKRFFHTVDAETYLGKELIFNERGAGVAKAEAPEVDRRYHRSSSRKNYCSVQTRRRSCWISRRGVIVALAYQTRPLGRPLPMRSSSNNVDRCNVKAEPENDEPMSPRLEKLPVTELMFSQAIVGHEFSDGSSFQDLLNELREKVPGWPLTGGRRCFLWLDAVSWPGWGILCLRNQKNNTP